VGACLKHWGAAGHDVILASQRVRLKPQATSSDEEAHLSDRPATRLYIPEGLSVGVAVALDSSQAHRLRHVLRLAVGATVAAFNAAEGEFLCRIGETGKNRTRLAVERQLRAPEPEPDLWLLFAPLKRARVDWLIEKATELGAGALRPVWTARTEPQRLNEDRLRALAVAAAEQSERLSVPEILRPEPFVRVLAAWPAGRRLVLLDESGASPPIAEALGGFPPDTPAALFVGPEGGFTDWELDALGKLPIVTRVGLGPRVLRAETAALAALAVFQAIAGDWRRRRVR
jgi:16S rRNA (uracil1498-N3)-methyltransferase